MYRLLFLLVFLFAASGVTRAQDFSYTVSTDSVAWNELNAQTILNSNNSAWRFSYKIPIGFTFNFCGRNFDSLTIETNGYIVFDENRNYAITAFSGVGDHVDGNGDHAVLGYELSGSTGNHILKIQYLNCSPYPTGSKVQSWQVWLKENGNVEVRVGPGMLRYNGTKLDSTQQYRIGFLNMNLDAEETGIFIGADPESPQADSIEENDAEIPLLDFVPARGYRYTFTPSN